MPNRINYQLEMEKVLRTLDGTRPKLLLHACCAPCSSATQIGRASCRERV